MLLSPVRQEALGPAWPEACSDGAGGSTFTGVESTDSVLAARLGAGDERALAELVDAHGPAVYRAALPVVGSEAAAQDVVQDVFVDLWCHPQRFDPTLGTFRTYLTLCGRHRAHDVLRSELRRACREERHLRVLPAPREASPDEQLADSETASAVRAAVRSLPPDQRAVVELAYFGGLSYREVARRIGIPEGTAKSRVRLALARLETLLDRSLVEPS